VRVVIADDSLLVRAGIVALLRGAGIEVVGEAEDADGLVRDADRELPDVAIVDIRMPPDFDDEGLRAAHELRARHPGMGIVILSQHVDVGTAVRVLAESPERFGYLLKDRVGEVDDFVATLRHVAAGGSALDPLVVSRLLASTREEGPLRLLTEREREVLQLVAEGRSNKGIADRLGLSERGVQKHITAVFGKFGLPAGDDDNRRILAVLAYLRGARPPVVNR
jgi:DNA-binding NarL/FixJ family response regulator